MAAVASDLIPLVYQFLVASGNAKSAAALKAEAKLTYLNHRPTDAKKVVSDTSDSSDSSSSDSASSDSESESSSSDSDVPAKKTATNGKAVAQTNGKRKAESSSDSSSEDDSSDGDSSSSEEEAADKHLNKKGKIAAKDSSSSDSDNESSSSDSSSSSSESDTQSKPAAKAAPAAVTPSATPAKTPMGTPRSAPGSSNSRGRATNVPFRRVTEADAAGLPQQLRDNSFYAKKDDWGAKANQILEQVRGKDFRHEKTKKKRGTYKGGLIDTNHVSSFKFTYDE